MDPATEGASPVPTARAGARVIQRLPDARPCASAFRSLSRGMHADEDVPE